VLGLGSLGSSAYHDPLREPAAFAAALAYNLPVLLAAELGVRNADLAFWGDASLRPLLFVSACATLALLAWLLRPLLARDAHARFWALGMLLSAVPVSASLPGERLLLCLGIGGSPLIAAAVAPLLLGPAAEGGGPRGLAWVLSAGLVLGHIVAAPFALPARAQAMALVGALTERVNAAVPRGSDIEQQALIVLNAPINVALSYLQPMRAAAGVPRPAHVHWLASASSELAVTRTAQRTLRVSLAQGFLLRPEETHYRADAAALAVGTRVALAELDARVVEATPDGRPKTVDFTFAHAIDSTRYRFMCYRQGSLVAWQVPERGATQRFPAQDFFQVIVGEMIRAGR
jgi:hypothetical protein